MSSIIPQRSQLQDEADQILADIDVNDLSQAMANFPSISQWTHMKNKALEI